MSLFDRNLNGFKAMRPTYTRKRIGYLGRYNDDGSIDSDPRSGLPADYCWVRFDADRGGTRVKNLRVRAEWGTPVWVEFNELTREDEVREVHGLLAPQTFGGAIAAALNVPAIPAGVSTPTTARDIIPGGLFANASGGLGVRIMPTWTPSGRYWNGEALIELTPTATASSRSFAIVGITSTGDVTVTLSTDRGLAYPLVDGDGYLAPDGVVDIQTVLDADPGVWWVGAVLLANGATEIDGTRIYDLRFWQMPTYTGATVSAAGVSGLVPAAASADKDKFLKGDGTYDTPVSSSSTPNFGAGVTKTLSSGAASAGSDRHLIIAAESGTADDLIEITGLSVGDEVIIRADSSDTITVKHNDAGATDKIILYNATDIALSGDMTLKLVKTASGKVVQYVDESGTGGGGLTHTYTGYNTAGGSNTAMLGGTAYMKKITLASAGWLGSIGVYIDNTSTSQVQGLACWVLTDNAGTPNLVRAIGTRIATGSFTITTTARWVEIAIGVYLAAGDYWLCVQRPSDPGSDLRIYYDGSGSDKTQAIGNPWSADGSQYTISDTTNKYSIRGSILS